MRSLLSGILLIAWSLLSLPLVSLDVAAADPPKQEKPIREIFVPFEDLDVLLGGDAHRVFLQREEYEALIAKAKQSPVEETPRDYLTLAADYHVVVDEGRATIEAVIELEVFANGLFAIPLSLNGVGIRSAMLDDDVAPLGTNAQGGVQVFVEGQGKHQIRLDLVTPLRTTAAQQTVVFRLPSPPTQKMRLTVPGNVEIRSGAAVSKREVDAEANVTRFELVPPRGLLTLSMSLNNRTLLQQRVVMARSVMVDEVTQAYERLHATVSMGVLHGAVEGFRFQIPSGFEVSDVASPLLSRWVVSPPAEEGGASILEVTLREPTTDIVILNLSATATSPGMDSWSMPRFEPLDVNNHVAVVGLLVEDRLAVEAIAADGLIPIDNAVVRSRLPDSVFHAEPGAPQVRSVVSYYAPQSTFELTGRFIRPPARTNVTSHILLVLDETRKSVRGGFSLQAEAEKIFTVDLKVPAGWTVTQIKSQDGADLPRERFVLPDGNTRMRIRLPHGIPLGQRFDVLFDANSTPAGWLDDWSEKEVEFPVFSVMGAVRDSGAIAVQSTDDLLSRPLTINGLVPLDEAEKAAFGLDAAPTSLAYQYSAQPYSATIQVERGQPQLTARTYSFLRVEPDGLSAHYEVLFDIRHARTKQLSFTLPADTPTALSVRGLDGVRLKEYNSELVDDLQQWTVLLADGQIGQVRLAVDFTQRLSEDEPKAWELPIIQAGGVSYQTAIVAVEGNSEFDIKLETAGRKIDVGELVDADYQVGRRLLGAYGFVGIDPQVTIDVFRRAAYGLPAAIVQRVEFVTLVSSSGRSQTVARYHLRTKATYLQIELPDPEHTELWSATLDGVPATPQRDEDSLLLSLPPQAQPGIRDLQLVYESSIDGFAFMGDLQVLAPRLVVRGEDKDSKYEVPVADLKWDLVLPDGHRILRTGGSVFQIEKPRRTSPLAVVAGVLWELTGGVGRPMAGQTAIDTVSEAPMSAWRGTANKEAEQFDESMDMEKEMDMSAPAGAEDAAPMEAATLDDLFGDTPQAEPAPAAPTPVAPQSAVPADSPEAAATTTQPQSAATPAEPVPPQRPARGKYWALEGVRSLQIELHERGQRVSFQSMGAAPILRATVVDGDRLVFLNFGLAMLVALIGIGLTAQTRKRKIRFVLEVALAALLLPLIVGWVFDLDIGATFDGAFYAACGVAAYYLAVAALQSCLGTARALRWPRRQAVPPSDSNDSGSSAGSTTSATTTVSTLVLLATLVPQALAQPANPPADTLTPAGLAALLQPPQPVKLPADAVIIPYDADDVDGLKNAERVMVPFEEYARLWNLAFPNQQINQQKPPAAFALAGAQYTTVLEDNDQLTVSGHLDVDVYVDEPVAIPLRLERAVLATATLDGKTARIQVVTATGASNNAAAKGNQGKQAVQPQPRPPESFVVVYAQGKGRHRLEVSVRLRLQRSGGWRQVDGVIPVAPSTKLALTVPLQQTEVRLSQVADRSSYETTQDSEQITTALDAAGNLQLQWRPKVGAGEVDQSLTVRSAAVFDIQEDGLRMAWQLNLQFRTQRDLFTMQLPTDYLVEKVTGENVRGWTSSVEEDAQKLDVTLLKATTGSEAITLFLSRRQAVGQGDLTEFEVPVVAVPAAVLHQGHLSIRRSPLLTVETNNMVGVSRTDATKESQAVIASIKEESPLGIRPYQEFRFVTTPFTVGLSAAPLADPATTRPVARTSADLQTLLRIGARQTSYECKVTVNVKQRPVHQVRVRLPAGFEFDQLDAPGVYEQATIVEAGRTLLTVYLAAGQRAAFSILIGGHVDRAADGGDVELPKFEVLDVGEQQGHFAIQADPAYQVRLVGLANCQVVPLGQVIGWLNSEQRSHADLAVSYRSNDYQATIQTALVTPVVKSQTISNVRVTTREIEETVLLRFEIAKAGIREVAFRLPARMREAQFIVPMLRQKTIQEAPGDPTSILVNLELQDDKMGELIVVVQNDVALSETQHEAPIPVVETGENLKRYVLLENAGRDEVVVAEAVGMESLRRSQVKWATLAQMLDNKITQAFEITENAQPRVAFGTKRRDVVETAGAAIRLAQATIVVDANGTYRAVQEFRVDNKTEQYLEIELPAAAELWTVRVADEPVKPTVVPATTGNAINDRLLRIPLIKTAEGDLDYRVEIKYGGQLGSFSPLRRIRFPMVTTKRINVELSQVRLHLPEDFQFFGFDGTMTQVYDEGDLAAGFLAYRNRQIEQLRQVMSGKRGVFSSIRAANNLKQLGLALHNYHDTYRSYASNYSFQAELRNNEAVLAEANRQMQSQQLELQTELAPGNRDHVISAFESQKAGKSMNIVNSLGSNFFVPEATLQEKSKTPTIDGMFNSRWLDENKFANQELNKKVQDSDRLTDNRSKAKGQEADKEERAQQGGQAAKTARPQFRTDQRKQSESTRRSGNERIDQIERYQSQLESQIRQELAPQDDVEFNRRRGGGENAPGQMGMPVPPARNSAGMGGMGGMGGGGFGGAAASRPGMQGRGEVGGGDGQPPMAGTPFGVPQAAAVAQPGMDFVSPNGMQALAVAPTTGNTGLASLDFDLPVRGDVYLFTTPQGDTEITVQAISKKQLSRWRQLGTVVACLAAVVVAGWIIVRVYGMLSRRLRITLLLLAGFFSLIGGLFPLIGLILLVWGSGLLVTSFMLPRETPQSA